MDISSRLMERTRKSISEMQTARLSYSRSGFGDRRLTCALYDGESGGTIAI
ncbi:MAG: hypothetical protein GY800_08495 [Planctomycetes bacterium]|nr:hypothetical protein [Planctomycetota bacterium]